MKVVQMMDEMVAKGEKEKHEEQVAFAAFASFCKGTIDENEASITKAKAEIEQLSADILKAQADQAKLSDEIAVLTENIDGWEKDKANLTEIREAEKEDLEALHRDLTDSIDATARAVETLKAQLPSGFLFLQKVATLKHLPPRAKRTIMAFLSSSDKQEPDPLSVTAPEAAAYEFQSGGVVEMLEKLDGKFGAELHDLEKKMIVSGQDFTIQIQELIGQIEMAEDESSMKTKIKAERAQDEASAKGDLATTENDLATDSKYLKDLITECDQKAKDFENRQMLRKDELVAINKAIEIMSSDEVMGTGEKHLPQFIQLKSTKASMSMLRSDAQSPLRKKLVSFLSQRAKETRSRLLAHLASRSAAGACSA